MRLLRAVLTGALVVGTLGACASGHPGGPVQPRDSDMLTPAQMERLGTVSLYQAVQALRPHWLSIRGMDSFQAQGNVVVIRDGVILGGPNTLNEIQNTTIASLRHYDGLAATARWGICCGHGVIYVSTVDNAPAP